MRIPRFWLCECGHLGQHHHDYGPCARCDCHRFHHPKSNFAVVDAGAVNTGRAVRTFAPPTRDARP